MVLTWWMHMTMKSFFFSSKNTICVSACDTLDVGTNHASHYARCIQNRNLEIETQLDKVKMDSKWAVEQGKLEPGHNIHASAEPVLLAGPLVPPWRRLVDEEENWGTQHKNTNASNCATVQSSVGKNMNMRIGRRVCCFGPESRCWWNPGLVTWADHSRIYNKIWKLVETSFENIAGIAMMLMTCHISKTT